LQYCNDGHDILSNLIFSFLSHGGRSYDVVRYYLFLKNTLEYPFIV
jgi:hypothetical protein